MSEMAVGNIPEVTYVNDWILIKESLLSWSQIRFNIQIAIVLRLNALFIIYILPENTGLHCNYKIIDREGGGAGALPAAPNDDAPFL